jgi:quercetin dioxygenase-like cupin family protein
MNELEARHQPFPHSHADFFQIATIISGSGIYRVGPNTSKVGPGSVLMIPAGVEHFISNTGDEPILNLDVFAPARADYSHLTKWMSK